VTYRGFEDLVKRSRCLLTNPEEADSIRKKGIREPDRHIPGK
jgi:hypothetical protein